MSRKIILQRERRRVNKLRLIDEFGGKCVRCGYIGHPASYDFHHIDPAEKDERISIGSTNYERLRKEAGKCVLLCSNCHREVHAKLKELEQIKSTQQLGLDLAI